MKSIHSRILSSLAFGLVLCASQPIASAQDENATEDGEERVLDTVEVTGIQNDAAMAAFRAGDYQTAEVEFLDNAMCALRSERNLTATIENANISANRAEVFANSAGTNSGANSQGAGAGAPQDVPTGIATPSAVAARNVQSNLERTCEMRGRQLYFAALSQIQLGKTDEALRNFERATVASKILYDAHYKIGLIKILSGDTRTAEGELRKIERILQRCRDCEARQEIIDRRDHLQLAINGDVSLN